MSAGAGTVSRRAAFRLWPGAVFVLLGLSALLVTVTIMLAHSDPSSGVEPGYYQQALRWDDTMRQRRINEALGWSVQLEPQPDRAVILRLRDAEGEALAGAAASLECFHHARQRDRSTVTLEEREPGAYASPPLLDRRGIWEFRLRVERDGTVFTWRADRFIEVDAPHATPAPGGTP